MHKALGRESGLRNKTPVIHMHSPFFGELKSKEKKMRTTVVFPSLRTHACKILWALPAPVQMLQAQKHRSWRYSAHEQGQLFSLIKIETLLGSPVFRHPDQVPAANCMKIACKKGIAVPRSD